MTRAQRILLLVSLSLGHFLVDMFGGFLMPLLPSLIDHLHTNEAAISLVAGISGIAVNTVQPLAGFFIHRFRKPIFLWLGPLLAAGFALMGLMHSPFTLGALVFVASLGVGVFHPSALLGAHVVCGRQDRLGIPLFLSGGAFGVALGAVLSTQWVHHLGYERLWWLALPGVALLLLFLPTGIMRLDIHQPLPERAQNSGLRLPFTVIMLMGSLLALNVTLLYAYYPMHLKSFLGESALAWQGYTLCIISIAGALSSYLWGWLSRRVSMLRMLAAGQVVSAVTLYWLYTARGTTDILYLTILAGFFAGGAFFPLVATLGRHAIGLTPGLRAGLSIGGCWAVGSLGLALGALLLKFGFTSTRILYLTIPLCIITMIIALWTERFCARREAVVKVETSLRG